MATKRKHRSSMDPDLANMLEKLGEIAHNTCEKPTDGMDCISYGKRTLCFCCKKADKAAKSLVDAFALV